MDNNRKIDEIVVQTMTHTAINNIQMCLLALLPYQGSSMISFISIKFMLCVYFLKKQIKYSEYLLYFEKIKK